MYPRSGMNLASKGDVMSLQTSSTLRKPLLVAHAVMIQHTLFSLPFAGAAILLETKGKPPLMDLLWIILAIFGARNGANAINRLVDHAIDARNPRTQGRELPTGQLKRLDLWLFSAFCLALLVFATFQLNLLCVLLLPVALLLIVGYSYTKRITWLCHYILGLTVAIAPMGSLLAITGRFELRYFVIAAAVALWVAGFDIIYACQDVGFDREEGLFSIPARFGVRKALRLAALNHVGAAMLLVLWGRLYHTGMWYGIGSGIVVGLLVVENVLVAPKRLKHITFAAYHLNEIIGTLFFVFVLMEVYLA
ncbi:MAG: 4-hydroxybenzoate octaprenyltransferase [Spirochaetae bacterium HGW-Spirochaetae-8]|nr:MAG: 4-hydroxybenzoate octaprenyltransferase [Spirochaetae bacterium HGW-Spirochaetae-8]